MTNKKGFKTIMTLMCSLLLVITGVFVPARVYADEETVEMENAIVETIPEAVEETAEEVIVQEEEEEPIKAVQVLETEEMEEVPEMIEEAPIAEEAVEETNDLPVIEAEEIMEVTVEVAVSEEMEMDALNAASQTEAADKIKITIHMCGIRNTNGTEKTATISNTLSKGSGWNILKKKFENNIPATEVNANGTIYRYTGEWIDSNGGTVEFPLRFQANDYEADVEFYYYPVYEVTLPARLEFNNIDNISTASHQWTNIDKFTGYTHTFKQPESQPHYQFVYWQDSETGDTYVAGDKRSIASSEIAPGEVMKVYVYTVWQPSVTVNYYDDNGDLLNSIETFEDYDLYAYAAEDRDEEEFVGWSYEKNGQILNDQTYEKPALTSVRVEQIVYNVYGVWQADVVIEHYQEELDGSFSLKESETIEDVIVNTNIKAESKEYTGFTFDDSIEGTLIEAAVKGGLTLKLFYTRNSYQVTYEYENAPEGAVLPEAETYKYGAEVRLAEVEEVEGYSFMGWDKEDFEMPDEDVNVKGSWQINRYTVTWIDENGKELEKDYDVEYGTMPSYDGKTPEKKADGKYTYTFTGWSPELMEVKEDIVYQATYSKEAIVVPVKPQEPEPEIPSTTDPILEEPEAPIKPEIVIDPAPIPSEEIEIEEAVVPMTLIEEDFIDIDDTEVPMAAPGAWALVNLIASILSVITALLLVISFFTKKEESKEEEEEEKEETENRKASKFLGLVPAIVSVIVFLLTEDMRLPMVLIDRYTLLMILILLISLALALITRNRKDKEEEYTQQQLAME
ncbi:MAG: hypothetical protein IKS51_08450 [Erysipelotrichaceae bacterium]|nr:hypothetical protein [Erysipelotrichaceae bacterium]